MRWSHPLVLIAVLAPLVACNQPAPNPAPEDASLKIAADVQSRLDRLVPTQLTADMGGLTAEDRQVVTLLADASRQMDEIFLRQVWQGNPALRDRLAKAQGPNVDAARAYFGVNVGPWDRLEAFEPFIGDKPHPAGAGYYPEDLTAADLEAYLEAHPDQREAITGLYSVIERKGDQLAAVPYSQAYRSWLEAAAAKLREAAALTQNASLRDFLNKRADAFLNDDYFQSEIAWMDLDSPVEITIGPYETYEDGLFGYKAAFESYVTVALPEESAKLDRYKAQLPWLESNLPIADDLKNATRGSDSPIRVVDLAAAGGEATSGVMAIAYNLPNDERVREAKGSKKVLMRNVMQAKFDQILRPIAERVLAADEVARLTSGAFLEEVLHHELSHGLGPGTITVDGRKTEVRKELKELYSPLEEAKADVMGIYNLLALMDKGVVDASLRDHLEPTYLAGLFRSARFGVHEAHGKGVVAQFNYLIDRGAIRVDDEGRFHSVPEALPGAIKALLTEMLMLQARGDYAGTQAFFERWGQPSEQLTAAIDKLTDLPTDIRPVFADLGGDAAR